MNALPAVDASPAETTGPIALVPLPRPAPPGSPIGTAASHAESTGSITPVPAPRPAPPRSSIGTAASSPGVSPVLRAVPVLCWGPAQLTASMQPDGPDPSLEVHQQVHGELRRMRRGDLTTLVDAARLRGRGGAGFPLADKLRTAERAAAGRAPEIVVNGAESEPACHKDRTLLQRAPHLVLDGAQLVADELGARSVTIWVHSGPAGDVLERAVVDRVHSDRVPVTVTRAPSGYLAGESSAMLSYLSGGPALPAFTLRPPAERGPAGRPVVVNNAETLADVAVLAAHGLQRFSAVGTAAEPGTMLLTVHRAPGEPVIVEAPLGTLVDEVLDVAGLADDPVQAVLVGGYFGQWLPAATGLHARLSHQGMAEVGGSVGAGVVVALPDGVCALAEVTAVVEYLAGQNAGQCGPCVNGLPALARSLRALVAGQVEPAVVQRIRQLSGLVTGRGACKHPDGVAQFAASALTALPDEIQAHLDGGCGRPYRGWLPVPARARR